VQFLDEVDRWWRSARAVLSDPDNYDEMDVRAALLPRAAADGKWEVTVQVALNTESLMLIPSAGRNRGEWEVGALLARNDSRDHWEMLGRSKLAVTGEKIPGEFVLHERRFGGLAPGAYELGAFVRDRTANEFGGARATLTLPRPARGGLAGPVVLEPRRSHVVSTLPLLNKKKDSAEPTTTTTVRFGPVPAREPVVAPETVTELHSWVCPEKGTEPAAALLRFVSWDEEPLFRLQEPALVEAGSCYRLVDTVDTERLGSGEYRYTVRWSPEAGERTEGEVGFHVTAGVESGQPDRDEAVAADAATPSVATGEAVDPERGRQLEQILARMANVAQLYRDQALDFTCDESIRYAGRGEPVLHRFRYLYRYSAEDNELQDYRLARRGDVETAQAKEEKIRLDNYGLPVYEARAYSAVFVFHAGNQSLFRYTLRGEGRALDRKAWIVDFEPAGPIVPERNDWYGTAYIDPESYQLLRLDCRRPEDMKRLRLLEQARERGRARREGYQGTYRVTDFSTEFDVEQNGMRFPGRVVIESKRYTVEGGKVREDSDFRVTQTYERYRFFGVRTREEIRTMVYAGAEAD